MLVRRHLSLTLAAGLLASLTACGGDVVTARGEVDTEQGFDAVEISGDAGKAPEVEWKAAMEAGEPETKVLTEGEGEEIAEGDQVFFDFAVENGFTREQTFSTYGKDSPPQSATLDDETLPAFVDAIVGQKPGARVALVASAEEGFGPNGNPDLGIGNEDSFLLVIDVGSRVLEEPEGAKSPSPAWAPKVVHQKGQPARLDFAGTSDPTGSLQEAVLVEGEGAEVSSGDTVVVNYLGQVPGKKQPFDESYSKQPLTTQIGAGQVVQGWDQGLVGKTVGSRVVLAVPPHLGYGDQPQPGSGIGPNDTMYFVIDILGSS